MSEDIRLQKYMADCGVCSRRKAESLIEEGKVKVNGRTCRLLGTKVNPKHDAVEVNGESIDTKSIEKIYIVLNKPRAVMTTVSDPEGRTTVMDLVQAISERVYPVGRLDYLSEGLLLMTNDGDFANKVIHPSQKVIKVYEVKVFGAVNEKIIKNLRSGVKDEHGRDLRPSSVRVIKQLPKKTWLEFRLEEGRNREIRKICEGHGLSIDKLKRVAIGGLSIEGVAPGRYQFLTRKKAEKMIFTVLEDKVYKSQKKSVNLRKKTLRQSDAKFANDEAHGRYRKAEYYGTLEKQKELRIELEKEKNKKPLRGSPDVEGEERPVINPFETAAHTRPKPKRK